MAITIQRAENSDAAAIHQLETQVYGEEVTNRYDTPMFIRFGYVFVAQDDGKIMGVIQAIKTNRDEIKVNSWFVHPEYQRRGIGRKLYQRLIQETRGHDVVAIVLDDNHLSFQAHRQLGFTVVEQLADPFSLGQPGVLMRRTHR